MDGGEWKTRVRDPQKISSIIIVISSDPNDSHTTIPFYIGKSNRGERVVFKFRLTSVELE